MNDDTTQDFSAIEDGLTKTTTWIKFWRNFGDIIIMAFVYKLMM